MDIVKVFKRRGRLAIRLPKKYGLNGKEVYIKRMGNAFVLIPKENSWQSLQESIELFTDDFMEERDQPNTQIR